MTKVSELVSQNVGSTIINYQTWGGIIYNVKAYGAKGDGVTDDTVAIQAAVDASASKGGGIVFAPAGKYIITSTISISKPAFIIGVGKGSTSNNSNGPGIGVTTFIWNGSNGGTMFWVKSANVNEYLFGGGFENFLIDGASIAGRGIRGSSIGYMKFKSLEGRSFKTDFMRIDADNGVLAQFNVLEDIHFVYGASTVTQSANGIVFAGNTSAGVTQNHIINATGLVYDGSMLRFEWTDNNIIEKVHAVVSGAGYTIALVNGTGGNAAKNLFKYVVGRIFCDSLSEGNRFLHIISEGGGLAANSGAQVHYEVEDYINDRLFTTHKYIMTDQKEIQAGDMMLIDGSSTIGIAALQWPCLNLADGTDGRIGFSLPPPYSWNTGNIQKLRIYFTTDAVTTNQIWRATIRVSTVANLGSLVTPEFSSSLNVPVNGQYTYQYVDVTLNLSYAKDDSIVASIQRNGADVNDTATGNIQVLGATLIYQATGPDSSGSGTWDVTLPYLA